MKISALKAYPNLLGGLAPQVFLRDYWQKKPLLIRRAIPDFGGELDRAELLALCHGDELESRYVSGQHKQWQLEHGPFTSAQIKRWKAPWTLLVQGVNLVLPAGDQLLRAFNFIPYARLDDLMVSYATDGGSVGPHLLNVSPSERVAVDGAFKVPSLRDVALTAPYFHNGSVATLMQVVEFYNRGGNFAANNIDNLAPNITPLHLSQSEKKALVAFLESLTDPRVAKHAAPFDHPQLYVPNGEVGDDTSIAIDGYRDGQDDLMEIPASGSGGYSGIAVKSFLGL